jgi:hypothetical protein
MVGKYILSAQEFLGLVAYLLIFLETRYGLGRHISTVSLEDLVSLLKVSHDEHVLNDIHKFSVHMFGY